MTIPNIHTIENILARPLNQLETKRTQNLLNRVENMILDQVPSLSNLCDADADYAAAVAKIEADVVARALVTGTQPLFTEQETNRLRYNSGIRAVNTGMLLAA